MDTQPVLANYALTMLGHSIEVAKCLGTSCCLNGLSCYCSGWDRSGGWSSLQVILLHDNQLTGILPANWGLNMQNTTSMNISRNSFEGDLPSGMHHIVLNPGYKYLHVRKHMRQCQQAVWAMHGMYFTTCAPASNKPCGYVDFGLMISMVRHHAQAYTITM